MSLTTTKTTEVPEKARRTWWLNGALWLLALAATSVGLLPITRLGLIQDDLVVLAEGLGDLWSGSPATLLNSLLATLSTGGHFLPVGAFATTVHILVVSALTETPLSVSSSWEVLRVAWIVIALVMAANGVAAWRRALDSPGRSRVSHSALSTYAVLAAITLATMQVHALWSSDPVLSYPLASWLTAGLGFLFVGCLAKIWRSAGSTSWMWVLGAAVIGSAGVLSYEEMIAAVAAGAAAAALMVLSSWVRFGWSSVAWRLLLAVMVPGLVFVAAQLIRLNLPQDYEGTQQGYVAWVLPVTRNGLLGALPLTNVPLTNVNAAGYPTNWWTVLTVVLATLALLTLAMITATRVPAPPPRAWVASASLVVFLLAFWVGATLIFAISAKYQTIIGVTLGNIYLYYAVALLALAALATVGILSATAKFGRIALLVAMPLVLVLGAWQWSINSRSLEKLAVDFAWTETLVNHLEGDAAEPLRCNAFDFVDPTKLPAWYAATLAEGLQSAYQGRFNEPYCGSGAPS